MPKMLSLKSIREARGISRNALANAVDVSRTTVVKLEEGETEDPGYELTMNLSRVLEVSHESLFLAPHSTKVLSTEQTTV